ncbi:LuxR C-terminal-related transcriptional regulator [Parafrankia sp. BMG5.11]|nr:LuxR C-terminal-related transcriptional regulator [Parafrankia sp. BMG5.11]TCJ34318.1 LuxR family transcriptional regulator [Parafrankia sp. BMG5.11]
MAGADEPDDRFGTPGSAMPRAGGGDGAAAWPRIQPPPAGDLPVVGTRLVPPRPVVPHVTRPRLLALLDEAVDRPLTVVCAPAGAGKTMALADWARSGRPAHPVVWLRVDPMLGRRTARAEHPGGDPVASGPRSPSGSQPGSPSSALSLLPLARSTTRWPGPPVSLWSQILRGLTRDAGLPPGDRLAHLVAADAWICPERFRRELVNQLAELPAPAVLVLDDAHLVRDPDDLAGLELLASEGEGHLRIVLSGRAPILRVHRLRAEGRVTEIGPAELAFTTAETVELLAAHGLRVPPGAAAQLRRATEGWAVGLRLAAACAVSSGARRPAPGAPAGRDEQWAPAPPVPVPADVVPGRDAERAGSGVPPAELDPSRAGSGALPAELDPSRAARAAIAEFLHAEVLEEYPEPVRRFLLRTSVLERISAPLAHAVSAVAPASAQTSAHLLGELARPGGFLVRLLDGPAATAHPGAGDHPDDGVGGPLPAAVATLPDGRPEYRLTQEATAETTQEWYRFHRMFASMLRGVLVRDPEEDPRELNLRAALWFAANDRTPDAARHASRAGDWWYLACLLVDGPALVDVLFGRSPELDALVAGLPAAAAGLSAECDLVLAVAQLRSGRLEAGSASLSSARAQLPAAGSGPAAARRRTLVDRIDIVEAYRAELAGEPAAMIAAARRLQRSGPPGGAPAGTAPRAGAAAGPARASGGDPDAAADRAVIDRAVIDRAGAERAPSRPGRVPDERARALALCARGRGELWLGRLAVAAGLLCEGAEVARRAGLGGVEVSCLGALALQYALRGRLRQAESHLYAVVGTAADPSGALAGRSGALAGLPDAATSVPGGARPGERWGIPGLPEAYLAAVLVHLQRAEPVEADRWLGAARMTITAAHPAFLGGIAAICAARLRLLDGSPDEVRAARRMLLVARTGPMPPLCVAARRAAEADLLVAAGNPEAARRLLLRDADRAAPDPQTQLALARCALACADVPAAEEALAPLLRADDGGAGLVAACVLGAVAAARRDDHARAGGLLARAVALAADEGMVAPFFEAGTEALAMVLAHPGLTDAYPAFVAVLTRSGRSGPRPVPVPSRSAAQGSASPRPAASRSAASRSAAAHAGPGASGEGSAPPRAGARAPAASGAGPAARTGEPTDLVVGPDVVVPQPASPMSQRSRTTVPAAGPGRPAGSFAGPDPARPGAPGQAGSGRDVRNGVDHGIGINDGGLSRDGNGVDGDGNRVDGNRVGGDGFGGGGGGGGVGGLGSSRGPWRPDGAPAGGPGDARRRGGPGGGSVGGGPRPGSGEHRPEPAERLSERELAVLSYLPTMLTTAEIAAEMYVSVNTVKTHLKSIYRKLDVARRRDAVHRARALHLL